MTVFSFRRVLQLRRADSSHSSGFGCRRHKIREMASIVRAGTSLPLFTVTCVIRRCSDLKHSTVYSQRAWTASNTALPVHPGPVLAQLRAHNHQTQVSTANQE